MFRKIKTLTAILFLSALPLLSACADPIGPGINPPVDPATQECDFGDPQITCET